MVVPTLSCFSSSSFEDVSSLKSDQSLVFRGICHFVYTRADEKLANKKSLVCHEKVGQLLLATFCRSSVVCISVCILQANSNYWNCELKKPTKCLCRIKNYFFVCLSCSY